MDNNEGKSISTQLTWTRTDLVLSILYFGGAERAKGAPEGQGWRHLADAHVTWHATAWLSLLAHSNAGLERTNFGTSHWSAGALYGRFRVLQPLHIALRGDMFREHVATRTTGTASPIFWPAPWVSSGTATIDFRLHEQVSLMLEGRHDRGGRDIYFGGSVTGDGVTAPFAANRGTQTTVTAGITAWF